MRVIRARSSYPHPSSHAYSSAPTPSSHRLLRSGELACIDRCVHKYLALHVAIGEKLKEKELEAQGLMQQVEDPSAAGGVPPSG